MAQLPFFLIEDRPIALKCVSRASHTGKELNGMSCERHLFALGIVFLACSCATDARQASQVPPFNTVAFVTPADIPDLANVE